MSTEEEVKEISEAFVYALNSKNKRSFLEFFDCFWDAEAIKEEGYEELVDYFFDILDEVEFIDIHEVQLENDSSTVTVTDVNYGTSTITVNTSVSWSQNDGIAFAFNDSGPDIGATESDSASPPTVGQVHTIDSGMVLTIDSGTVVTIE